MRDREKKVWSQSRGKKINNKVVGVTSPKKMHRDKGCQDQMYLSIGRWGEKMGRRTSHKMVWVNLSG